MTFLTYKEWKNTRTKCLFVVSIDSYRQSQSQIYQDWCRNALHCICIRTQVGIFTILWPEPGGAAWGKSRHTEWRKISHGCLLNQSSEIEFVHEDVLNPCSLCKDGDGFSTKKCGDECEVCEFIKTRSEQDHILNIMNQHDPSKVLHHFRRN